MWNLSIKRYMVMGMTKIVKNEMYKFFKNKKNIIVIILFFAYLLGINFYNLKEYKMYMNETKQVYLSKYSKAEGMVKVYAERIVRTDIFTPDEIKEIEELMNFYRVERSKLKLIERKYVNNKPAEYYKDILVYQNERYDNILKSLNEGVIDEKTLSEMNLKLEDIKKEMKVNQYILDNEIDPIINPYTMTGANSLIMFLEGNNLLVLIFLISLLAIDIYLSELEEGCYK